ncbi:TRAP transporter small permease [Profundibacterium mesophilum]|uniref:TRAP transporter small permease protein n=1 Tax=Profundibacterium mesophilum KAUST100406-0324 TaxID=1037889 RepID=A0A921NQ33_9RHOB|nr:TRAP transporter small permease subunit [Profundibacterium mesophilum]KAF0675997.1 TRAP dicarboxylate transporter subunit DctQ [Profundibacterium mesophilum KAUST100406-0324]
MSASASRTGLPLAVERAATLWAMAGGALLLLVVAINVASVIGGLFGKPFAGDFELTEVGTAVAVFAFLPFVQITDANVSADIFTQRAPVRLVAAFGLLAALVAMAFALLLGWRMYLGMLDQKSYDYTTAIVQFPHWIAFLPILASIALLALCAAVTAAERLARIAAPGH